MEHRWGSRTAVDLPVRITCAGISGTGTLRNVSISGAFMETSIPLAALTMVRVQVRGRRGDGSSPPAAWGFVVRHERHGVAVEWCDEAPAGLCPADAMRLHPASRPVETQPRPQALAS